MVLYKTERLILRSLSISDSALLLDYLLRNKDFLQKWEPKRQNQYYTINSVQNLILNEKESFNNRTGLSLYIFNKKETKIIGNITFSNIIYGVFQSCFLGYKLDKHEIKQGKITEALRKAIEIIFKDYRLHRVEANIIRTNTSSIKVIQKLGFTQEGYSKKYLKINGNWEDHLHFALLNAEVE